MFDISKLKFDENGLIPAVVVDFYTREVLTLAYMNKESLEITMAEGRTCFWSRSRKKLWRKGEESGNVQHVCEIKADCDGDALTVPSISAFTKRSLPFSSEASAVCDPARLIICT